MSESFEKKKKIRVVNVWRKRENVLFDEKLEEVIMADLYLNNREKYSFRL